MLIGVVLCGGQSTRMGTDKALLVYHQQPQYLHVAELLNQLCDKVVISCNTIQLEYFEKKYELICDNILYQNAGPMTGVLSVFEKYPNANLFVVGCDYPYLQLNDLHIIKNNIDCQQKAICYINKQSGFLEPLLAIYKSACFKLLNINYLNGQNSLKLFLKSVDLKTIEPNSVLVLKSVDYPN
ncbi:MAG: molybdenum cofactor guanylyltransferase [Bacteroidia bacterium]